MRRRSPAPFPTTKPCRLHITGFAPSVVDGRYAAKRVIGDVVTLTVDVVCDGAVELLVEVTATDPSGAATTHRLSRENGPRFTAPLSVEQLGRWSLAVECSIDHDATMRSRIARKEAAGVDVTLDRAELAALAQPLTDRVTAGPYPLVVDREVAGFASWYEFFPRSTVSAAPGTLAAAIDRLPYIADLGFDVVYLPPVHPIGMSHRKGANNSVLAGDNDVGSPWAIGGRDGGHTSVHPELGSLDDLAALADAVRTHGMELALDIAFQCSPDHPWVVEHPEWFTIRADGSIAYAENPPKRYQDIVPFDFDTPAWVSLWQALAGVIRFWQDVGIRTFRVDNPHTKPIAFWEWLIADAKQHDPGAIFLAEAFTNQELMLQLSRVGFSQSYTHFPWQHSPAQLEEYHARMSQGDDAEHFRQSAWPNTPDILTEELQQGLQQVFISRLVLATTLSAVYGIYGPVFELGEPEAVAHGSEEYRNSEKYQVRHWDLDDPRSISGLVRRLNGIRRSHVCLRHDRSLHFHRSDNPRFVAYSKTVPKRVSTDGNLSPILVVVNTDHHNAQDGILHLDLAALGLGHAPVLEATDLLTGATYLWPSSTPWVRLDPWVCPAHVFQLRELGAVDGTGA